jgi:protein ImuB
LWQLKLEALKLPAPVLGLRLSASQYCSRDQSSADLYAGKQGQYSPLQLIGLLQAKLGAEQVRRPIQLPAFLPEVAGSSIAVQRLGTADLLPSGLQVQQSAPAYGSEARADNSTLSSSVQSQQPTAHRPAFLFATPEPLQQQVRLLPGLERIQSQWWQGSIEARDYLTAQSADGRWLWIYRTDQQQWFVHGVFA